MLFLPIPAFLIDVGLAFSIALSVLILMVALWIGRPLDVHGDILTDDDEAEEALPPNTSPSLPA